MRRRGEKSAPRLDHAPPKAFYNSYIRLVVFNHNLKHTVFGGGKRRRMFTINLARVRANDGHLAELATAVRAERSEPSRG